MYETEKIARGVHRGYDPVLGDDKQCVVWYGDLSEDDNLPVIRMVKPGETQESQTYVNRTLVFLYAGTLIRRISAYFLFLPSTRQQFSDILVAWSLFSLDMHACFFLGVGLFCFFTAPGCSYGCPCTLVVNAHSFSMCYLIYSWLVVVLGVGVVGLLANFPQLELVIR